MNFSINPSQTRNISANVANILIGMKNGTALSVDNGIKTQNLGLKPTMKTIQKAAVEY
jgi:hypothetical protein